MKLRDLIDNDGLQVSVVVGQPQDMDRVVSGAYITDLPDPSPFISAGDVVLTSGLWTGKSVSVHSFIDALADRRAAALLIGIIEIGIIPETVIDYCRERSLALLTVSPSISFKTISSFIVDQQPMSSVHIARKALGFSAKIADTISGGGGSQEVLDCFRDDFAVDCWIINADGSVAASAGRTLTARDSSALWNQAVRTVANETFTATFDGAPASIIPMGLQGERDYFILAGSMESFSQEVYLAVEAVVNAVRVERALVRRNARSESENARHFIGSIARQEVSPGAISARMRIEGMSPKSDSVFLVAAVDDPHFPHSALRGLLIRALGHDECRTLAYDDERKSIILANGTFSKPFTLHQRLSEHDRLLLDGRSLAIGVSDFTTGVSRLGSSFATAMERMESARGSSGISVSTSVYPNTHEALLRFLGTGIRSGFTAEVLGPLLSYDKRHNGNLLTTLRVFLANDCSWQETSTQLHMHINTLRYRITRIEELLNRDIGSLDDRVDLVLAFDSLNVKDE